MVHKIKLGGKEFDCEIGLAFLGEILEVLDLTITELGSKLGKNPFKYLPPMLAVSIQVAADLDDKESPISDVRDVVKLIEEDGGMLSSGSLKFLELFNKYMTKGLPKPEEDKEEDGKPTPKKKVKTEAKKKKE